MIGKQSLYGYHFEESKDFIKVYVTMPSLVPGLKRLFDDGISLSEWANIRFQTYESNVPFVLRFMIDNNISGADWIELLPNTYSVRTGSHVTSRCSLEVDIFYNRVVNHECSGKWSSIAPLRVLSFDIECKGNSQLIISMDFGF